MSRRFVPWVVGLLVVVAVFVGGIFLGRGLERSVTSKAAADKAAANERDLAISEHWLKNVLPTGDASELDSGVSDYVIDRDVRYSFDGCTMTVKEGRWLYALAHDPAVDGYSATLLYLKPQPGLHFVSRDMSVEERNAFQRAHPSPMGNKYSLEPIKTVPQWAGDIVTVDFRNVSLTSIQTKTLPDTTDTTGGKFAMGSAGKNRVQIKFTVADNVGPQRVVNAFMHIAKLCGATVEPF